MPCSTQAPTRSSGTEAPSRKLKAERAWSSVYISRRPRVRTIPAEARRNKSCIGRVADTKKTPGRLASLDFAEMGRSGAAPLQGMKQKTQFLGPIHPAAKHLPATNPPSSATAPKPPPLLRASHANTPSPAARPVPPPAKPAPAAPCAAPSQPRVYQNFL